MEILGTFRYGEADGRDADFRLDVLMQRQWFGQPEPAPTLAVDAEALPSSLMQIRESLNACGAIRILPQRILTNSELIRLGAALGELIPEQANSVQKYVEERFILNNRQDYAKTNETELQPFAENYITLHTEMSPLPPGEQPRYIVLMCVQAPQPDAGGQTLLVSMSRIYERLAPEEREILRHTTYGPAVRGNRNGAALDSPPFLYERDGRPVFSFRDFDQQLLPWRYFRATPNGTSIEKINDAIHSLLAAMYEPANASGIRWSKGAVWIMDNTRFFHGKTFCEADARHGKRWLKRLRIREPESNGAHGCQPETL
jgi:alpha-ketoglutarate-dependent taurine dioxygenase